MKRLRVEHTTGFTYERGVSASYNEARMLPRSTEHQFVLSSSLDIEPASGVSQYVDYFGTRVAAFDVLQEHTGLNITARSLVEVRPQHLGATDISWESLGEAASRTVGAVEMLAQTPRTEPAEEVAELARRIAGSGLSPEATAREIVAAVTAAVDYTHGVTGVHSTAAEAWAARKGVCQDFGHIAIGALREVGIPARYVSGYLHPVPDAEVGVVVTGESHAWLEWFVGEWQGFDPANDVEIGDRHVFVGRGRDYTDVPPLRGIYAGPAKSQLHVQVQITREM